MLNRYHQETNEHLAGGSDHHPLAHTLLEFSNWPDRELAPRIRKDFRY
jgi:hypothetical protein